METTGEISGAGSGADTPHPDPTHEPWLDRWKAELGAPPQNALDLGCGGGGDTRALAGWGHTVTAIDHSEGAITLSRQTTPGAIHHTMDLRAMPGPLRPGYGIIVASLSLHYFDEPDTRRIFGVIRDFLLPGGILAFRVNAEDDYEFGATGSHDSWACVEHIGVRKQFFTPSKIRSLLAGWTDVVSLEKRATFRFGPRKSLYETIARRYPG